MFMKRLISVLLVLISVSIVSHSKRITYWDSTSIGWETLEYDTEMFELHLSTNLTSDDWYKIGLIPLNITNYFHNAILPQAFFRITPQNELLKLPVPSSIFSNGVWVSDGHDWELRDRNHWNVTTNVPELLDIGDVTTLVTDYTPPSNIVTTHGTVGLPIERFAIPLVYGTNYVHCWDDRSRSWLVKEIYDLSGFYEFQVPAWNQWFWVGVFNEDADEYVYGKWIGHFLISKSEINIRY
jgi:hypothetical protein